jgi:hypothetical protein
MCTQSGEGHLCTGGALRSCSAIISQHRTSYQNRRQAVCAKCFVESVHKPSADTGSQTFQLWPLQFTVVIGRPHARGRTMQL